MTTNRAAMRAYLPCLAAGAALLAATAPHSPAAADERKAINLGTTSFFDGFGGSQPGCTYIQYAGHGAYSAATDANGNKAGDVNLNASYLAAQLACGSTSQLFGGTPGWNTIVPAIEADSTSMPANGAGLGDIMTGPYISWAPVMRDGRPVFAHGIEFDVWTATGKYSSKAVANPGNDYWSINPFWKATWLPSPGWEVSWRLNYIHNFDHLSKTNITPDGPDTVRNADGFWVNFTVSRELFKDFYFGLNGYWLKQLGNDKSAAGTVADSQVESLYMGPGLHYTMDPANMFNVNLYLPVYDANTLSGGYQVNLQYIHPLQ